MAIEEDLIMAEIDKEIPSNLFEEKGKLQASNYALVIRLTEADGDKSLQELRENFKFLHQVSS